MEKNLEELLKSDNLDTLQLAYHLAVGMGDERMRERVDFAYMNAWAKQQKSLTTIVLCGTTKMMERVEALRLADMPELPSESTFWDRVKAQVYNPISRIDTIAKHAEQIKKPDEERVKILEVQLMSALTHGSDSKQMARIFADNKSEGKFVTGGVAINPKYVGEYQVSPSVVFPLSDL